MPRSMVLLGLVLALMLVACRDDKSTPPQPKTEQPAATTAMPPPGAQPSAPPATAQPEARPAAQLANPASVNCGKQGGKTVIRKGKDGGEVGYCVFPDGSECEEWALFRGACKQGQNKPAAK